MDGLNKGGKGGDNLKATAKGEGSLREPAQKTSNVSKKVSPEEARRIRYHSAEKFSIVDFIKKNLSKDFMPTQKSGYALGAIFLLVIIIGLLQFPFTSFLSGEGEFAIKIGFPYPFFVFDIINPENSPFVLKGFVIDLLIYVFAAYIIDVLINFAISFIKSTRKSEQEKKPEVVKAPSSTLADKLTKSVASKPPVKKGYNVFGKPKSIEVFEVGKKQKNI